MQWDPEFLACLRSPDTRRPLRPVGADRLARLNELIRGGEVVDRGGERVAGALDDALQPEGEDVVYPVVDEIPDLLVERAIPLPAALRGQA